MWFLLPLVWALRAPAVAALQIGIIGGGPAGLSLGLALEQLVGDGASVSIFDRSDQLRPQLGGGVQLNSGAAVLARLGLAEELLAAGQPVKRVLSRNVGGQRLLDLDLQKALRGSPKAVAAGVVRGNGDVLALSIMRDSLQAILYNKLMSSKKTQVTFGKDLCSVIDVAGKVRCAFEDGTSQDFDLVIGADGLRSKVRRALRDADEDEAVYDTGINIQWGVAPAGTRKETDELHQWFAPDGVYCLASTYGGLDGVLYDQVVVVSPASAGKSGMNAAWDKDASVEDARARLRARLEAAKMPGDLVDVATKCERVFELSSHGVNPLGGWTGLGGKGVLVGDAAHAMAPFLGQGTNQAVQDGYCLASEVANNAFSIDLVSSMKMKFQQNFITKQT